MRKFLKVEGHNEYVRDVSSGVVLNINKNEINLARERKKNRKAKEQELEEMKTTVQELKDDMIDIKSLLNKIVERI